MGVGMISAELHNCLLAESLAYLKSLGNREGMTLQRQRGCKRSLSTAPCFPFTGQTPLLASNVF